MIHNALSTLLKFFIGAVAVGALLNAFDIRAEDVLQDIGFTPRRSSLSCARASAWAIPHFLLPARWC